MLEKLSRPVKIFQGTYTNIKITTPDDLIAGPTLFAESPNVATDNPQPPNIGKDNALPQMRMGQGYDVHRLVAGRPLILGGLHIPFEMGLDGHSDADVLTHAIINALFGAAGLGDIGRYFPPSDPTYKGISSLDMLAQVNQFCRQVAGKS